MHIIFKPKGTILLTLTENSHKSFQERETFKTKLKRNQTSANGILSSGFGSEKLWLFILSNDGH